MAAEAESKKVDAKVVDPKPDDAKAVELTKKKSAAAHLKTVWPMIWELVRPRRGLLALSFLLLLVGRLCGLVLPAAPKYLLDDVIGKHRADLLLPLVLAVLGATLVRKSPHSSTSGAPGRHRALPGDA